MSPLFLANWKEINRVFCALCWLAALALAVVIFSMAAGPAAVSSVGRSAQAGPAAGSTAVSVHRHP